MESKLKSQKGTKVERYCVCRSSDGSRFMICCDKCTGWFHGDCMNVTQQQAKRIEHWFCPKCVLSICDGAQNLQNISSKNKCKTQKRTSDRISEIPLKDSACCGQCSNCLRNEECGNKSFFERKKFKNEETRCELVYDKASVGINQLRRNECRENPKKVFVQCMGPNCLKPARVNSKYCSHDCGYALNHLRLISIIPNRILEQEQVPCMADINDHRKLKQIRDEQNVCISNLQNLDKKEKILQELINRGKRMPVVEAEEESREEDETKMYCVTCGWDIPIQTAIRHMELCFRKVESHDAVVEVIEKNSKYCRIFCNFYDSSKNTFCKRLRYVCPDHYKLPKAGDNEVCGCPMKETILQTIYSGVVNKFCQRLKKNCYQHFNWESLFLADIDFDRFRELNKINTLFGEEYHLLRQLTNRCNVVGLLLHSTRVHK